MSFLNRKVRGFRLIDVVALGILVAIILSVYLAKTMAGKERAEIASVEAAPAGAVTFVSGGTTAALSLAGIIDLTAERARLEKEIAVFESDIGHVNKKLGNPNFVARAAPEVVDEQRAKLAEAEAGKVKLQAALARLSEIG